MCEHSSTSRISGLRFSASALFGLHWFWAFLHQLRPQTKTSSPHGEKQQCAESAEQLCWVCPHHAEKHWLLLVAVKCRLLPNSLTSSETSLVCGPESAQINKS